MKSEYESYVTIDGQSVRLSLNNAPICGLRPGFYYCQTVASLLMWDALSDERTCLSFTIAAGPRQSFSVPSHVGLATKFYCLRFETSLFVAPYDLQGHGGGIRPRHRLSCLRSSLYSLGSDSTENTVSIIIAEQYLDCRFLIRCRGNLFIASLPSNERLLWLPYSIFQASCHNTM
jgi:hypothetical protein